METCGCKSNLPHPHNSESLVCFSSYQVSSFFFHGLVTTVASNSHQATMQGSRRCGSCNHSWLLFYFISSLCWAELLGCKWVTSELCILVDRVLVYTTCFPHFLMHKMHLHAAYEVSRGHQEISGLFGPLHQHVHKLSVYCCNGYSRFNARSSKSVLGSPGRYNLYFLIEVLHASLVNTNAWYPCVCGEEWLCLMFVIADVGSEVLIEP